MDLARRKVNIQRAPPEVRPTERCWGKHATQLSGRPQGDRSDTFQMTPRNSSRSSSRKRKQGPQNAPKIHAGGNGANEAGSTQAGGRLRNKYEDHKPMLADPVAMESRGRFANLIATPSISEKLREAMACTSLVAAKSGTEGLGGSYACSTRLRKPTPVGRPITVCCSSTSKDRTGGPHDASSHGSELGRSVSAQCFTQPTRAITRDEKGDSSESFVTTGLDQGDPFSPVAFTVTHPLGKSSKPLRWYSKTRRWTNQ